MATWRISCGSAFQANRRCDTCSICDNLPEGSSLRQANQENSPALALRFWDRNRFDIARTNDPLLSGDCQDTVTRQLTNGGDLLR
jgi:hypothetical protein